MTVLSAIELAEKAARIASAAPMATVSIVGKWLWIDFPEKPSVEVRDVLKAEKCRWNRKRGCWQFAGTPTRRSRQARPWIEAKYGAEEVEATT